MEINCPAMSLTATGSDTYMPSQKAEIHPRWLLELDTDGTIRHSSSHPAAANNDGTDSLIGSNFFDLTPVLGDLSDLKRNFFGFVRSRESASLKTNAGIYSGDAVVVLTRSFDTSWPTRREVVLMEIRSE